MKTDWNFTGTGTISHLKVLKKGRHTTKIIFTFHNERNKIRVQYNEFNALGISNRHKNRRFDIKGKLVTRNSKLMVHATRVSYVFPKRYTRINTGTTS